jgi:lipid A ethanolaminephosphotransferase
MILSAFTLAAYHIPFFRLVLDKIEGGFNGVLITAGLAVLMLALNHFFYYLVLYTGRFVGRCILAFTFVADAISLYFINSYEVLITDSMMGNVFNTQFSEASGFFSLAAVLYVLFLGVIPCIFIFAAKTDFGSFKRFMANIGLALGIAVGIAFVNIQNWPWIDRNSTELGSLLMPWSYTVNTVRFYNGEKKRNQKEILLPDAQISNDSKDVCILIIGESARRDHFSLYGYEKPTNPLLAEDDVTSLIANSAATYTTAGVKAILDHQPTGKLYEILPNYMYRTGVDVIWRTSNWGEPPVHIEKYHTVRDLKKMYPDADDRYDGILLTGLKEEIMSSEKDKILVILHTNTSHGPTYNKKYPAEFERFTPVCTTVEMSKANPQELMNAYDNSVLYTDYLIHSAIEILKEIPDRRACMLYVSDHGESLGEGNLYMHGVPMSIAPKEQVEIPFIVWTSIDAAEVKELDEVGQCHVFHSVMDLLGVESPVFDEDKNIFR